MEVITDQTLRQRMSSALIVNHTLRIALNLPRAVRLFKDVSTSTLHCGWTQTEWDDFEREVDQGLHSPETLRGLQRRRTTIYFTPENIEDINNGKGQL